jgi:hypothetical protein
MPRYPEDDEIAIPLVSARGNSAPPVDLDETRHSHPPEDRMSPSAAGGAMGVFAGAAAFAIVHFMEPLAVAAPILEAAREREVDASTSFAIAYATAAAVGAFVGAAFASVTQYLRRFVPLLVWSVIFFVSLALLLLAAFRQYGGGVGVELAPAILAATIAYAFIVSFALPLRVRC